MVMLSSSFLGTSVFFFFFLMMGCRKKRGGREDEEGGGGRRRGTPVEDGGLRRTAEDQLWAGTGTGNWSLPVTVTE